MEFFIGRQPVSGEGHRKKTKSVTDLYSVKFLLFLLILLTGLRFILLPVDNLGFYKEVFFNPNVKNGNVVLVGNNTLYLNAFLQFLSNFSSYWNEFESKNRTGEMGASGDDEKGIQQSKMEN
jgi:hypothetical protein